MIKKRANATLLTVLLLFSQGLLLACASKPGPAPTDELLNQVWGYPPVVGDPAQVRNAVRRLLKKLQDGTPCPGFIATVRGVGYRWDGGERLEGLEEETERADTKRLRNGYRADMKRA